MQSFAVSPAALSTGIGDLEHGIEQIEAQLADLRDHLAPIRASWDGSASSAWTHYQKLWDTAAADLVASLGTLHTIVATAHRNYSAAEAANARIWAV